jgi:hypothetical protein
VARRRLTTFALGGLLAAAAALMTATGAAIAASGPQPDAAVPQVQMTLIKVLCPSYAVVPANANPTTNDATGGHGGQLDTSYQTILTDPSTDIPKACVRTDGWQFQLYGGFSGGVMSAAIGSPLTTGADGAGTGAVTISLDASEQALAASKTGGVALWVVEIEKPGVAAFGALRCYKDILNGDNRERIAGLSGSAQHIYCIAYNVDPNLVSPSPSAFQSFQGATASPVVPTATPVRPTQAPAPTCTPIVGADGANAVVTPCPSPFQSFQGETSVPDPTSTPPPTSTGGGSAGGGTTPLTVLLFGSAFSIFGLIAIDAQRRRIRS